MMRGSILAATRGARFMSAAAAQPAAPSFSVGRIAGVLTEATRDGPRQRHDGSDYWIDRYVVEMADGSAEQCSRFINNDDEPLPQTGGQIDWKVKRRGEFPPNVVSEDYGAVIETTLFGKVLTVEREGPILSAKGNEWYMDWYTVESEGVEHKIRRAVFDSTDLHLAAVGDELDFKVSQRGNYAAELQGLVRPEVEEVQGKVVGVSTVGPRMGANGKEYTMEFYTIETKPGVGVKASRFLREGESALAEVGQKVSAALTHTPKGYTNLLSLHLL